MVYFPDTRRFKELNRKLRDWLVTLDVNDVKDIYDEKCSEDVLKNPADWVRIIFSVLKHVSALQLYNQLRRVISIHWSLWDNVLTYDPSE